MMRFGGDHEFSFVTASGKAFPATLLLPSQQEGITAVEYKACSLKPILYEDGMNGEFCVGTSGCREYLQDDMWYALKKAKEIAAKGYKGKRLKVKLGSGAPTTTKLKESGGRKAMESGCDPDLNAYTGKTNYGIPNYERFAYAVCGFHLHCDVKPPEGIDTTEGEQYMADLCKIFDLMVTLPFMLIEPIEEHAKIRRAAGYGRAGSFRIKDYGIEYRTLSGNGLLCPEFSSFLMGMCRTSHQCMDARDELLKFCDEKLETAINSCSRRMARALLKKAWPTIQKAIGEYDPLSDLSEGGAQYEMWELLSHPAKRTKFLHGDVVKDWRLNKKFTGHGCVAMGWNLGMLDRVGNMPTLERALDKFRSEKKR